MTGDNALLPAATEDGRRLWDIRARAVQEQVQERTGSRLSMRSSSCLRGSAMAIEKPRRATASGQSKGGTEKGPRACCAHPRSRGSRSAAGEVELDVVQRSSRRLEEENAGEEDDALPLGLPRLDPARDDDVDDLLRCYPMATTFFSGWWRGGGALGREEEEQRGRGGEMAAERKGKEKLAFG